MTKGCVPLSAETTWKEVVPALDVLETAPTKSKWLVGPSFSLADLNVAGVLYHALFVDLAKWPRAPAWLNASWERPAAKKATAMREK